MSAVSTTDGWLKLNSNYYISSTLRTLFSASPVLTILPGTRYDYTTAAAVKELLIVR